jgi:hypothetical protein
MGLDKLENMAPLPYFESTAMMMPQTVSAASQQELVWLEMWSSPQG